MIYHNFFLGIMMRKNNFFLNFHILVRVHPPDKVDDNDSKSVFKGQRNRVNFLQTALMDFRAILFWAG